MNQSESETPSGKVAEPKAAPEELAPPKETPTPEKPVIPQPALAIEEAVEPPESQEPAGIGTTASSESRDNQIALILLGVCALGLILLSQRKTATSTT